MDPLIVTVLVSVACLEAEQEGRAGEIKVGFIWSIFRTDVDSQQRQTRPNGSRQADKRGRDQNLETSEQNRKIWLKDNGIKLH